MGGDSEQTVIFLHGLGEGPEVWKHQIAALPASFAGIPIGIPGLRPEDSGQEFSFSGAANAVAEELDEQNIKAAHLVGLSLGAMVALQFAADHPGRLSSITLAAAQVKPPRLAMAAQRLMMSAIPARSFARAGIAKKKMLTVLDRASRVDLSSGLGVITVPTLVLCGTRDRPNLAAARSIAQAIPRAELHLIEGAGHRTHAESPKRFSELLNGFLLRTSDSIEDTGSMGWR